MSKDIDLQIAKKIMKWRNLSSERLESFNPSTNREDANNVLGKIDSWMIVKAGEGYAMRIVDSHKGKYIEDQFIICDTYEMAVCIGILEVADKYPHLLKKRLI
ncbi:hypothetical protein P8831_09840 [Priestia megaterium]|uniref:hypothetical protein n=1 Tax=Priestia megaterium TaxID=1404 RepID=UPI002D7F0A80|nr:hypothetical protein [Priestia megaterium]MEB4869016.1 hypothetical protein [Priestia megaterium]